MRSSLLPLLLSALVMGCQDAPGTGQGRIVTDDAFNFVDAYDRMDHADTTCVALESYFREASDGLRAFPRIAGGREALCQSVLASPARYADLDAKLAHFDLIESQLKRVYADFTEFFPNPNLLDTYVVVGRGWWGGTVQQGRIFIGLEVMEPRRVPCLVAHELVHAHQRYPRWRLLTGGPEFIRGTLLAQSIKEGSADFVAELVTGCSPDPERHGWAEEREAELWSEFQREMNRRDYSMWIYNGWNRDRLGDRPADLGYYMGYKIAEAFYEQAEDKKAAVQEILRIHDFPGFLLRSGYDGHSRSRHITEG